MAIISASRKTDIPTYFSDWFLNRLDAREFFVRNNPYKPNAVTHITFDKDDIDCIVFWTKNPIPMLDKLDRLNAMGYPYYFQFTLTGYGKDYERGLPDKKLLVDAFKKLSEKANGNVVWRYDPIIVDKKHDMGWHLDTFFSIAQALNGYTNRCVISFVDLYQFVTQSLGNVDDLKALRAKNPLKFKNFCQELGDVARQFGMEVFTCAEEIILDDVGIKRGSCIDKELIEKIVGYKIKAGKDKGQRSACLCAESIDIGTYDTCRNGCRYCYACKNPDALKKHLRMYFPTSPILCDALRDTDVVTEKVLHSLRVTEDTQLTLF